MTELSEFLEINGLSQNEIAEFFGVGAPTVSKICTGMHQLPKKRRQQLLENTKGWDTTPLQTKEDDGNDDESSVLENEIDELNKENERLNQELFEKDNEIVNLKAQIKILTERAVFLEQSADLWSKIAVSKEQLCKEKERVIQMMLEDGKEN